MNKDRQQREEIMKLFKTDEKIKSMVRKCINKSEEMEEEQETGTEESMEETD